jgi:hypothetical protein
MILMRLIKVLGITLYILSILPILTFIGLLLIIISVPVLTLVSISFYIITGVGKTDEYVDKSVESIELGVDCLFDIGNWILK